MIPPTNQSPLSPPTIFIALLLLALPPTSRAEPASAKDKPLEFSAAAPVVLQSSSQAATFDAEHGRIAISSRQGGQTKQRAEIEVEPLKRFQAYRTIRDGKPPRQGVEIFGGSPQAEFTLLVDDRGVFEFKPGKAGKLVLRGLHLRYGMVPGLVGTDFLYDAQTVPGADRLHVPSLNMVLGFAAGEDCTLVGVWPPGKQSAAWGLKPGAEPRPIDSLSVDTAGQSLCFAFLERPGIWHAEPLKRKYLEKETVIGWKRPFEAKWIGRFFITSDEYDWPFYFGSKPTKIWGRYIRGWYNYPLRFDGDATVVHFERQFLPKGDLLIYCLEPHPAHADPSILTPVEVLTGALGKAQADKILDPEGTVEQTLLEHRLAVCAMTNSMQKWVDEGKAAAHREKIMQLCDDTAAFIRMIRQRAEAFGAFARETQDLLAAQVKERPELAAGAADLRTALATIQEMSLREVPKVPLETVRKWTAEMKKAAEEASPESRRAFARLGAQCRSVAGTQDDLARTLSIQVIRFTEQAARIGVQSPQHARLAEELIVRARQVLRKPTWWEPTRRFQPKSDPGNRF